MSFALSTVGNAGNSPDSATGFGEVDYTYKIGSFDVTCDQYATFLNAVAQTDTYDLYNTSLGTDLDTANITRLGSSGSYTYTVAPGSGSDPVTYVSWLDAARFCNWLENGQPTTHVENASTTEQGSYTLNGDIDSGGTTGLELANPNAVWRLPTLNEWYKAAYYDPNYGGLGVAGYWTYATRSNDAPNNVIGSGTDEANYDINGLSESSAPYVSPVGSFTNSASHYGTYDQNGDVFQWDTDIYGGDARGMRGGSWTVSNPYYLASTTNLGSDPAQEASDLGFRIETSIPEPGAVPLGLAGIAVLGFAPALRRALR